GSEVRPRMHAYLATVCRSLGAEFVHVGGVLPITFTLSRRCRELFRKLNSSKRSRKPLEMDQRARRSLSRLFLATGLWGLFGMSESAGYLAAIRQGATRAPSHTHVSGGIQ